MEGYLRQVKPKLDREVPGGRITETRQILRRILEVPKIYLSTYISIYLLFYVSIYYLSPSYLEAGSHLVIDLVLGEPPGPRVLDNNTQ